MTVLGRRGAARLGHSVLGVGRFLRSRRGRTLLWMGVGGVVLAAIVSLGRYAYRQSSSLVSQSEEAIRQSNAALTDRVVTVIEREIIASDHTLFDLIDLGNLARFSDRWTENLRHSPQVEAAAVIDEQERIVALASRSRSGSRKEGQYRAILSKRVLPELALMTMRPEEHAHHHTVIDGDSFLFSYTRRVADGKSYFIVLSLDMDYLLGKLIPSELEPLREIAHFSVVDVQSVPTQVVYGDLLDARSRFLIERQFPSTLWRWRVQMAPRNVWELSSQARKRRSADLLFMGISLGVIVAGMVGLYLAMGKAQRASELKSEFVANVSHELKTPLSLIRMFSELLGAGQPEPAETGGDPSGRRPVPANPVHDNDAPNTTRQRDLAHATSTRTKEYAEIILRESDRLARLIDNVLDFARLEKGRVAYEFRLGNPIEVAERTIELVRPRFAREGVALEIELGHATSQGGPGQEGAQAAPEKLIPLIRMDENALTLALLNLLENAAKYASPGKVRLSFEVTSRTVTLAVSDDGPGIPLEEQPHVFQRFYRGKSARTGGARGSGLGLALVKEIVVAHGGTLTLESRPGPGPGSGATFRITLPAGQLRPG